mgnify:CR=1 FL=1
MRPRPVLGPSRLMTPAENRKQGLPLWLLPDAEFGGADGQIPDGEVYAVFMIRQSNAINGKIELSWGMHLQAGGGQVSWSMF